MNWFFICLWLLEPLITSCQYYCKDTSTCTTGGILLSSGSLYCQEDYSCSYKYGTTSITVTNGDLYCNAESSCYGSSSSTFLISAYYNIYCQSTKSCGYSSISAYGPYTNANGYCYGYNSCQHSQISYLNSLECWSGYSCENSTIKSVQYIYGVGYYSLQYCSIYSTGLTSLHVYLRGYRSGYGSYIYCDDTCYIDCDDTGCENVNLVCSGTCYVTCDVSAGTICPNDYLGPTEVPTSQPSNIPTDQPIIVTLGPTNVPSNTPTDLPNEKITTNTPINQPTETPSDTIELICLSKCDNFTDSNDLTDSNGLIDNGNDDSENNLDFMPCLIDTANIYILSSCIILFLISLCINIILVSKNGSLKLSMKTIEKMHSQSQLSLQNINVNNDNDLIIQPNTAILRNGIETNNVPKNIQMVSIKSSSSTPIPQNTSAISEIVENENEDEKFEEDENENTSGLPKLSVNISASVHEGQVKPNKLEQLKTRIYKRTMSDPEVELMFEPPIPTDDGSNVKVNKLPPPRPKRRPKPPKPKGNHGEEGNEDITGNTPGEFMD